MEKLNRPFIRHFFVVSLILVINLLLLQGCNSSSSGKSNPDPLAIAITTLPSGQIGAAYNATLVATGGTPPLNWTTTSGTLPAGLKLNASTGAITGTPTAAANNLALTFQVQDSGSPMQSKSVNLTLTIAPATLAISTTSLPNGQVGAAYSTTLVASGGTTPYNWTLTSGSLPANLQLNTATGAITGTPTVSATSTPLTFQVKDASSPQQSKSVSLSLTIISAGGITVSLSPKRGGLTITQPMSLTATTNDPQGVMWTASGTGCSGNSCGTFSSGSSLTGVAVTYTAPASAGVYVVTATSVTSITTSTSVTIGVTDLPGVFTWHNNLNRDGSNPQEYALTPALVNTGTFGKLFTCAIDAAAYAQPLWVANVSVNGARHNVLYVVTEHDTIYAFDADTGPCVTLVTRKLLGTNETWLSSSDVGTDDITPDIGIVGTPVIDPATNTLYVVAKTKATSGTNYIQRLHALSLNDLTEKANSPVQIAAGNANSFALIQNQRAGLVLSGNSVYVTWASHGDRGPYHGYIYQFDKTSLAQTASFNSTPTTGNTNANEGGIWMTGAAPAVDNSGNLYCITGNGTFDAPNSDYGDSFLKLSGSLSLLDYFTPSDQSTDESGDLDFGSGGAAILINSNNGTKPNLAVGGGKDTMLYVLNRDQMGHFGDTNALQHFSVGNRIFSTAAFWQNTLYIAPAGGALQAYPLAAGASPFGTLSSQSSITFPWPGSTPSVSSQGTSNGVVWAIDSNNPAELHAYDATNLHLELWNSTLVNSDAAGNYVKFTVPTIANGKVYLGNAAQVTVYGLKPN
jgi:Putative Ig domain